MTSYGHQSRAYELVLQRYGAALLAPNGQVSFLNPVGAEICRMVGAGQSAGQMATWLAQEFEVERAQALEDVVGFLDRTPVALAVGRRPLRVLGSPDKLSAYEADLALTLKCNLKCAYCYASAGSPLSDELTTSQWLDTTNALVRLGLRKATIAGGEPLLSDACMPVMESLREKDVCVQLFTNGVLLTDEFASRVSELGLNFVQVSLDATSCELNDRHRGNSFEGAMTALKRLVRAGVPTVIGANIFPDSLEEVKLLAELARSLEAKLRCNPIEARGRAATMVDQSVANEKAARSVYKRIQEVSAEFVDVFLDERVASSTMGGEDPFCPFARGSIAVSPSGRIRLCSQADAYFETVAPWSLDERRVWEFESIEQHSAFPVINELPTACRPTRDVCGDCPVYGQCNGCLPAGYTCLQSGRMSLGEKINSSA